MKIKHLALVLFFLASLNILPAQAPEAMNFQAVARLSDGTLVRNRDVSIRVTLIQEKLSPQVRYEEIHQVHTNDHGFFKLMIGMGERTDGSMADVEWQEGQVKLNLEIDIHGGSSFEALGSSDLLTVPYSFHAKQASSVSSSGDVSINAQNDILIGDNDAPDIYINSEGKMGLGTKNLDDDERKDIEMGVNKRFWGYSSEYHLDKSGVFNLQCVDSLSKPAIVWYDHNKIRKAAIVAHKYSGGHDKIHNHWSIETTNKKGELFTRMEFPLDRDWTTIETHSADFKVGDCGDLIATGDIYAYGMKKVGIGDKNWDSLGLYEDAKWEFYRNTSTANLLIHQASGDRNAELILKKKDTEWEISNRGTLKIRHQNYDLMSFTENHDVGIGLDEPEGKLHVDGNVLVTKGHGFYTSSADFAEYFRASEGLSAGDIVGIDPATGLAGKYRPGYVLIGIASNEAGFVGNSQHFKKEKSVLVGLVGQLSFNKEQTIIKNGLVYTLDMKMIGVLLADGRVFLKIN